MKPGRFQKRVERFKNARKKEPSSKQRIAGIALATIVAVVTIYLLLVIFVGIAFHIWVLAVLGLCGAIFGALLGRRAIGHAGLAGIGAGIWIFFEVMLAGLALVIEAIGAALAAVLSSIG